MKFKGITLFSILLFGLCIGQSTLNAQAGTDLNALSELFLEKIKKGENTQDIQEQLAKLEFDVLANGLKTDAQRFAFWVNTYNAYIQIILLVYIYTYIYIFILVY